VPRHTLVPIEKFVVTPECDSISSLQKWHLQNLRLQEPLPQLCRREVSERAGSSMAVIEKVLLYDQLYVIAAANWRDNCTASRTGIIYSYHRFAL
jgi:hypothetical protein